jgi:molecular chaperone GrpE
MIMARKNTKKEDIEQEVQEQENIDNNTDNQEDTTIEKSELEVLQEELGKEKDRYMRLFAEFENYKRRTAKERLELFVTASEDVLSALLPVVDDFERALPELEKGDKKLYEGVDLIYKKLLNTVSQKGLEKIEVKAGDVFDADIHEAITQIPAPNDDLKGKIIDTVAQGYKLGEKIIRYPKVVLGK